MEYARMNFSNLQNHTTSHPFEQFDFVQEKLFIIKKCSQRKINEQNRNNRVMQENDRNSTSTTNRMISLVATRKKTKNVQNISLIVADVLNKSYILFINITFSGTKFLTTETSLSIQLISVGRDEQLKHQKTDECSHYC